MSSPIVRNFMKQQGFADEPDSVCDMHFSGLSFQPKILGALVVIAILLRSPALFFVLSITLWWNIAFPKRNVFEMFYNRVVAAPRGRPALNPAPSPRLFAQGMASSFMFLTGVALISGWMITAWILEAFLVIAISALLFGKFCLGRIFTICCAAKSPSPTQLFLGLIPGHDLKVTSRRYQCL